eukprot:scaffold301387_cov24-Prasinocladus_malaysianus.AAC.1
MVKLWAGLYFPHGDEGGSNGDNTPTVTTSLKIDGSERDLFKQDHIGPGHLSMRPSAKGIYLSINQTWLAILQQKSPMRRGGRRST